MKKYVSILCVCFITCFALLTSCSTFDIEGIAQVNNAAVVSVFVDKSIDMSDFESLASFVSQLAQDEDFHLQPVVNSIRDDVFKEYSKVMPFLFMPEETALSTEWYKNRLVNNNFFDQFMATAPGHAAVDVKDKTVQDIFTEIPEADAVLSVYARYKLVKAADVFGFGLAYIRVFLYMTVVDKNGITILDTIEMGTSDNTIEFALGGVFDASEIVPLCEEATKEARKNMIVWIKKELAK